MLRCRRPATALLLFGLGAAVGGCRGTGDAWSARPHDPDATGSEWTGDADSPSAWPFAPTSMRIHPLTRRIDADRENSLPAAAADADAGTDIEVRIECVDADGFETRAIGSLVLDLEFQGTHWSVGPVDLSDARINLAAFEGVTRTYRIGVALPSDAVPESGASVTIRARLRLPGGTILEDSFDLPWR